MKPAQTIACVSLFSATVWAQAPCRGVARPEIHVTQASVSLADLLAPASCPELLQAAARARLGAAPLRGCPRIMDGDGVRARLRALAENDETLQRRTVILEIPPRVVLRAAVPASLPRSGRLASRGHTGASPLVKRGQKLELLWDQRGIRLKLTAICLQAGNAGESVRARLTRSGRVLRALVLPDGSLLVSS